MRCAHHSTRGKPGRPAPLDASPAPAAPTASLRSSRPGFPRLTGSGAGAFRPPLRHRQPWGCLTLGDGLRPAGVCLAAPCPRFRPGGRGALGGSDCQSSPHLTPHESCGGSPSLLSVAQQLRAFGLLFCRCTDWLTRLCAAPRLAAASIGLVAGSAFASFMTSPPIAANLAQPGASRNRTASLRAPLLPVPLGCGLGCAYCVLPLLPEHLIPQGDELRKYGSES